MNNEPFQPGMPPNQQQWAQQAPQTQWGPQQPPYAPSQYAPGNVPPYAQPQYGQYNVPPYAQPQQDQTNRFLMGWLMTSIAMRIVFFLIVPLILCGGCAIAAMLSSLHP